MPMGKRIHRYDEAEEGGTGPKVWVCNRCGTPNRVTAAFCKSCRSTDMEKAEAILSTQELVECPSCGDMTAADSDFCDQCCAEMFHQETARTCPGCGAFVTCPDEIYCHECNRSRPFDRD